MRHIKVIIASYLLLAGSLKAAELLPPGHRPTPPGVHALTGGKVIVKPGQTLESATILIRDGLIEAVGSDLPVPPEALTRDMRGLTIYAGFIDPCLAPAKDTEPITTTLTVPVEDQNNRSGRIRFFGVPGEELDPGLPGPGHESDRVHPQQRVADILSLKPDQLEELRALGLTAANVAPGKGIFRGTGAFTTLADAGPNETILKKDVFQHVGFAARTGQKDEYPRSLMGVIAAVRQTFLDAAHYAVDHRHYQQNPRGRSRPVFNPALDALGAAADSKRPVLFEPGSVLMDDRAARVGRELSLDFLILACGEEWRRPDLVQATRSRFVVPVNFPELPELPSPDDWTQVSLDQLRAWDWAPENPALLRANGLDIALTTFGLRDRKKLRTNISLALKRGLSETDALAALTTVPANWCGVSEQLGTIEPGKLASLTVVKGSWFNPKDNVREVWIEGHLYPVQENLPPVLATDEAGADARKEENPQKDPSRDGDNPRHTRTAQAPLSHRGVLAAPKAVLVRNATVWTSGPEGRLENADLLVVGSSIRAIGKNLEIPVDHAEGALTIDATGKHVTPGLIDAHSHSMILGGVNEGTLPSTAMVQVGDVVNSETANIYKQLAGGLTVANLLHGSANPIGGQNAVIKLRDGASPEELKFEGAPAGIKFALGENVKQSNWGDDNTNRFPQTRMGVQTFLANRFTAARRYLEAKAGRAETDPPFRRDLELEALGEIIAGKRWIHCHSYRQDEILALLRLMESFNVTIGTLQHVLEGYKIADEIAAHGAGASCFSDWWAYKFEVYDAIPYAGSLMRERGVLVSFNSDSSDLARRMNLEAAKAVKYGGTSETDALKFVTLNPARQLRIDARVGSLEPGKDADFVLWSRSPLDSTTLCLQTWIDGKKYFDRDLDPDRTRALRTEREQLLEKARKVSSKAEKTGKPADEEEQARFFKVALEHQFDAVERHCMD